MQTRKKNTEALLMAMTTKEIGLEINTEQTKYRFMSRKQSKGHSHNRKKTVPLQTWSDPEGSRKLWFPDYMTRHKMVVRLSALGISRLYPQ